MHCVVGNSSERKTARDKQKHFGLSRQKHKGRTSLSVSMATKWHNDFRHLWIDNTIELIKRLYWFSRMRRYVGRYIYCCLECLFQKRLSEKHPGELYSLDNVGKPFYKMHLDYLGPFSEKQGRKRLRNCGFHRVYEIRHSPSFANYERTLQEEVSPGHRPNIWCSKQSDHESGNNRN